MADLFAKLAFDVPRHYRYKLLAHAVTPGRDRRFTSDQRGKVVRCLAAQAYEIDGNVVRVRSDTVVPDVDVRRPFTKQETDLRAAIDACRSWVSERDHGNLDCWNEFLQETVSFADVVQRALDVSASSLLPLITPYYPLLPILPHAVRICSFRHTGGGRNGHGVSHCENGFE